MQTVTLTALVVASPWLSSQIAICRGYKFNSCASSVTWCNKHFSFSPIQNDSVRCWIFFILPRPFPIRECHSLKRVSMTLHLNVATSCTGQPHWRLQTHRGMNSNRLCVRWWQRETSEKTASPRSFHLTDIRKSPTSQKFSCAEITGEERTVSETAHYGATTFYICTYIGCIARVQPACFPSIYRIWAMRSS